MALLSVQISVGESDAIAMGMLRLDTSDGGRAPRRYRLARHIKDLPLAAWTEIDAPIMDIPWMFPGFVLHRSTPVFAEVEYETGAPLILTAHEHFRLAGTPMLPRQPYNLDADHRFKLKFETSSWPLVHYNDGGPSLYNYPLRNNFMPLDWSPLAEDGGYCWSSEFTRGVDRNERPPDIIVGRIAQKDFDRKKLFDLCAPYNQLSCKLAGEDLDMKGGHVGFALLCMFKDHPHGRYHLQQPLEIGKDEAFAETRIALGDEPSHWRISFAGEGAPLDSLPPTPDLSRIGAIEIIFRDFAAPPTGKFKIKELAVRRTRA